jgi:hypothetical protein
MITDNTIFCSAVIICLSSIIIVLSPNLTAYAQVQDDQAVPSDEGEPAKLRCSDGSLADSSSECPASDQCPSSTADNHLLQCTSSLLLQATNLNTSEREVGNINITTDKKTYKPGEAVNITIKNIGAVPLTFPNSILGLTIQNAFTHEKYPLMSAQVITTLDSGGQKLVKWNQTDSLGQQVRDGNYTASTSSLLIKANTTFSVVK